MTPRPSVVVVGAGVSGLAAAWDLTGGAQGPSAATPRVEVIDSAARVGGCVTTTRCDGDLVDCGADGFLARRPEVVQLVKELAWDDALEPIGASGAWIYLAGHLNPLPSGLQLGVPTVDADLRQVTGLSRRARRDLWRDRHFPRSLEVGDDATIGEIVRAKLGDEIALQFVEPMIGGIQAGRIDNLSAAAVFPALLSAARRGGSLQKALASPAAATPGPTAPPATEGPAFYTLRDGVGSLPLELENRLRARGVIFSLSTPVTALRRSPTSFYGWEVDTATTTTPANAVVVATPPAAAARLTGGLHADLSALGGISSASAAMVTLSLDASQISLPPTGTGILVPLGTPFADESLMVTAITLLDRKWPHLRRDGRALVRVHVGRSDDTRFSSLSDDELLARVVVELGVLLGGCPTPRASLVVRWPNGLPQYHVGHLDLVSKARAAAAPLHLHLAGNAYDGVGIPASIGSGRRAGRDALGSLASSVS